MRNNERQPYFETILLKNIAECVDLTRFEQFCQQVSSAMDESIRANKFAEFTRSSRFANSEYVNFSQIEMKNKLLLFILFSCESKISSQDIALKKKRAMFSNELRPEEIKIEILEEMQEAIHNLGRNRFERELIEQIDRLRIENINQKQQINSLINKLQSMQLQLKQGSCNLLLKLNDLINQRSQSGEAQSLQARLEVAQFQNRQNQNEINKMKIQLKLQTSTAEHLKKQHASIDKQRQNLKREVADHLNTQKRMKDKLEQFERKLKQEQEAAFQMRQQHLISFFNTQIKSELSIPRNFNSKIEIINHFKYLQRSLLSTSEILNHRLPIQQFITSAIEALTTKTIAKTRLLYKFDSSNSFGACLTQHFSPFLVLIRLENDRICGAYSPGLKQDESSFMFTFLKTGKVFHRSEDTQIKYGCQYANNALVFGNNELTISNHPNNQFKLNVSVFAVRYFELTRMSDFVEGDDINNTIKFQEMEIHSIFY